jgi:hypothetical protein
MREHGLYDRAAVQFVIPLALIGVASAYALRRWPTAWAQVLIWVFVLQNIVDIAVWKLTGSTSLATNLIYAKEVMIAGGAVVTIPLVVDAIQARKLPIIVWLALAFGAVCVLWVLISYLFLNEPLEQVARGLRSLAYPAVLLVIGVMALPGKQAALRLRNTLWWTGIVLGLSVIVERTFIPPQFWLSIGLDRYWVSVKGESLAMLNGGLPWNFFVVLLGSTVRRGFGIMTDPLALSYYLLLPLGLAVAEIWRARIASNTWARLPIVAAVLCAAGVTFSLSRVPIAIGAGLVVLAPLVMIGLMLGQYRRALAVAVVSGAIFGVIGLASVASTPHIGPAAIAANAPLGVGSEGAHAVSILRARDWQPLVLGKGLGTAGYLSAKYADTGADIGYENIYLDTAAQIGILGALLMAAMLAFTTLRLLRGGANLLYLTLPTATTFGLLAVAGVLSGQLEVITSLGTTWLFCGVMLAAVREDETEVPQEPESDATARDVVSQPDLPTPAGTRT